MVDAVNVFRRQATVLGPASQRQYVTLMSKLLKVNKRGLPQKQLAYLLWKELQGRGEALDTVSYRAGVCMGGEMQWTRCRTGQMCAWEGRCNGHDVIQGRCVHGRGDALDMVSSRAGVCMGGGRLWTRCHAGQVCAWEGGGSGHGVVQGRYVGVCT